MPDAKSLLPGRAFRSEHAQLRPEPHSIASHGPAPMDPLQTTRMRNGVLYAAEWPCCHDPLRLSLGSEDPFSTHAHAWRRTARFPPSRGGRCDGCGAARASPACGEARRTRTLARGLGVAANKHKQTLKHLAPARRSFGQRPRRAACASRAWEASSGCADDQSGHRHRRRRLAVEGEGGLAPPVAPRTLLHKRLAGGPHWPPPHTHSSLPHHSASHRHQNYQCRTKNIVWPSPYYALGTSTN